MASILELPAFPADDIKIIGGDPNLLKKEIPWNRILTDAEKRTVTALADVILPADEFGPAASTLGVTDFIDEWVSAPYEPQQADLKTIRAGLAWIDQESQTRFQKPFADATVAQQTSLLEDIVQPNSSARKAGYNFFKLFRDRAAGAYYSTPEGWKALGYVGNMPLMQFPEPTEEALRHAGLL